jgi:membrane-bound lytic murein transglycosylase D
LIFAFFLVVYAKAQVDLPQEFETSAEPDTAFVVPETLDANLDKLMNLWFVKNYTDKTNHEGYLTLTSPSDSDYIKRLSNLPCIMELPYNATVRKCIDLYTERRRSLVEYMLGLESVYFPMIEETLDKYGLPLELKHLTIIESALNPTALSRAGASGLWQFMLPTAKLYGLEINTLVDERLDPAKATDAACRFMKDLYDIYKDWTLVIAAYNCGGGNVNKAIRRAKGKTDFWEIYPYLPRETRTYVPFFIAANYVMNYYAFHQLYPVQVTMSATDTIMVNRSIHFEQIATVLNIDKEEIKALNPQYKREIIPGNFKPQVLKLPAVQAYAFVEHEDEIANYNTEVFFPKKENVIAATNTKEKIVHVVKKGETLVKIGSLYGVSVANIRKWNNLGRKSRVVSVGRKLTLYINNGGYQISKTN